MIANYIEEQKKSLIELRLSEYVPVEMKGQVLRVLGVPNGGPIFGKDEQGDYFSDNTNIGMEVGDRRPVFYNHGLAPNGLRMVNPKPIGQAVYTGKDHKGHWFEVELDEDDPLSKRIIEAAKAGQARASSGAINYLVRRRQSGEVTNWTVGELTLLDKTNYRRPVNEFATVALKSAFDNAGIEFPQAFLKSGELESDAVNEKEGDVEKIKLIVKGNAKWIKIKSRKSP